MNNSKTIRLKTNGFTLVEMMITVSILGILASIAVPNMMDLLKDAKLSSQSDLLITSLSNARLEAIKQKKDIQFCPVSNANTATACSTNAIDWSNGWIIIESGTNTILQRVVVQKNITINSGTGSPTLVTFNSTHGSATPAINFSACIKDRKQQNITVSLSGHVSKSISSTICS
ncbi:GspH/FimT family pseudopilin [Deefgea rivuli]|uniref:GspH/FimT family pseudopilin n=1 Tax=Deefgea rivuli TaxID=400948 RepID=UPI0005683DA7|nr:GspH/FimT family pseudopilin [Deefgea rivuli]